MTQDANGMPEFRHEVERVQQCIVISHGLHPPGPVSLVLCLRDSVLLDEIEGNTPITAEG